MCLQKCTLTVALCCRRSSPADGTKMMVIMQSREQMQMLAKFGTVVNGLDATYKTTMWGFPLFNLTVVDNHGHGYPACMFFIEEETSEMVEEALRVIKGWNPGWDPAKFMIDKSDVELNAITAVR